MRNKIFAVALFLCFVLLITNSMATVGDNWKLVVRVSGTVENMFAGGNAWNMIWQSRKLKDGDRVRTLADSRAKVRLADQSVVTLGQNTEVEMSQFQLQPDSRFAKLKLFMGKVRANVGRFTGKESKFEVETPNAVLAARGTDFYVEFRQDAANQENKSNRVADILSYGLSGFSDFLELAQNSSNSPKRDEQSKIVPMTFLSVYSGVVTASYGSSTTSFSAGQTGCIGGSGIRYIPSIPGSGGARALSPSGNQGQGHGGIDGDLQNPQFGSGGGGAGFHGGPPNYAGTGTGNFGNPQGSGSGLQGTGIVSPPGIINPPQSSTGTVIVTITPR